MDLGTLIGLFGGLTLVGGAMMLAGPIMAFVDAQSAMIVLGGAVFTTLMKYPLDGFLSGISSIKLVFSSNIEDPKEVIDQLVSMAETARKNSILALEKVQINEPFMQKAIKMLVDGVEPDVIEDIMAAEMEAMEQRHGDARGVYESLAEASPGFGMIGTVIGLIVMMGSLDNPDSVGPAMAVALITTLYGNMFTNLFFAPFSAKLKYLSKKEMLNKEIVMSGIGSIVKGENPRLIRSKLEGFLAPKLRGGEES